MTNPVVDVIVGATGEERDASKVGRVVAIYPASGKAGLTSWEMGGFVEESLRRAGPLLDPVPESVLASSTWLIGPRRTGVFTCLKRWSTSPGPSTTRLRRVLALAVVARTAAPSTRRERRRSSPPNKCRRLGRGSRSAHDAHVVAGTSLLGRSPLYAHECPAPRVGRDRK